MPADVTAASRPSLSLINTTPATTMARTASAGNARAPKATIGRPRSNGCLDTYVAVNTKDKTAPFEPLNMAAISWTTKNELNNLRCFDTTHSTTVPASKNVPKPQFIRRTQPSPPSNELTLD